MVNKALTNLLRQLFELLSPEGQLLNRFSLQQSPIFFVVFAGTTEPHNLRLYWAFFLFLRRFHISFPSFPAWKKATYFTDYDNYTKETFSAEQQWKWRRWTLYNLAYTTYLHFANGRIVHKFAYCDRIS